MTSKQVPWRVALLAGFAGSLVAQEPPLVDQRPAIAAMYTARLQAMTEAANPNQAAEAYVRDVTHDAVWMPPNAPPVRGKPAVLAWARDFFATYELKVDSQAIEPPEISGTIPMRRFTTVGRYVPRAGGPSVPFDQKYLDILRREPDGSWKLSTHIWSSNNTRTTIWH